MYSREEIATITILSRWRTPTSNFNKEVAGNLVKNVVVASVTTAREMRISISNHFLNHAQID
jgi:uncharacterized protein YejL (UPF0352 family)